MTELALITLDGMPKDIYDEWIAPEMDHSIEVEDCLSSLPAATTPATHHLQTGYDGSFDSVYGYYSRAHPDDKGMPSGLAEGCAPLAIPTFFEVLDDAGFSCLINWVPNSWPATAYNLAESWVIGGLQGSNHSSRQLSTDPPRLARQVGAEFGATMQEPGMVYANEPRLAWRRARDRMDARLDTTLWAADRFGPDFVWHYVFSTDHCLHWNYPNATHELLEPDVELFGEMMKYTAWHIDDLISQLGADEVAICSDHGFRPYSRKAMINAFLVRKGFLHPGSAADGAIDPSRPDIPFGIDLEHSTAICRKDKIWVEDGYLDDVIEALESWRDPYHDVPIIGEIVQPEWEGPLGHVGPDIVVRPSHEGPGYDFYYPGVTTELTIADSIGAHSKWAICGGDIEADRIHDIGHAICDRFGVDLAASADVYHGRDLELVGAVDRAALEQRLQDLGYL